MIQGVGKGCIVEEWVKNASISWYGGSILVLLNCLVFCFFLAYVTLLSRHNNYQSRDASSR